MDTIDGVFIAALAAIVAMAGWGMWDVHRQATRNFQRLEEETRPEVSEPKRTRKEGPLELNPKSTDHQLCSACGKRLLPHRVIWSPRPERKHQRCLFYRCPCGWHDSLWVPLDPGTYPMPQGEWTLDDILNQREEEDA